MPCRFVVPDDQKILGMNEPRYWYELGEAGGLFNWAIEGLRRLRQQGHFTVPAICEEELAEYRREMNPARMFLTERYHADPTGQIPTQDLYGQYRPWVIENGYRPLGERAFGKEVRRIFPDVDRISVGGRADRHRAYLGIAEGGASDAIEEHDAGDTVEKDGAGRAPCTPCEPCPLSRPKGSDIAPIGPKRAKKAVSKEGYREHGVHGAHGARPQVDADAPPAEVTPPDDRDDRPAGSSSPDASPKDDPDEDAVDLWDEEDGHA